MSPRSVLILALLTALATAAAVTMVLLEPGTGRVVIEAEPAFPALRADPDAVARIVVRQGGEEVVLSRTGSDRWVSETDDGYPVDAGRVRALVVALSDMQLVEAKTRDPERFARLEVEDPELEDARSRLLTLTDGDGGILAEAVIGKERNRLTGTEPAGTYIRRPGEDQSWLATGRLDLAAAPDAWLERQIVDVPAEEVVEVEVTPPEGPGYTVRRTEGDGGWVLDGPEGEQPIPKDADPTELAGVLAGLQHQGIARADEVSWPDPVHRVRLTTDRGLRIAVRAAEVEGEFWASIEALPVPDEADADAAARAEAISGQSDGWAYALSRSVFDRLTMPLETWVDDGTS